MLRLASRHRGIALLFLTSLLTFVAPTASAADSTSAEYYTVTSPGSLYYGYRYSVETTPTQDGGFLLQEHVLPGGPAAPGPRSTLRKLSNDGGEGLLHNEGGAEWVKFYPASKFSVSQNGIIRGTSTNVARLDLQGEQAWTAPVTFSSPPVTQLGSGHVFAAAHSVNGPRVYRWSEAGQESWVRDLPQYSGMAATFIRGTVEGGCLVLFQGSGNSSLVDLVAVRFAANGEVKWQKPWHSGANSAIAAAIPTGTNWVVATSSGPASRSRQAPHYGGADIWALKLDDAGTLLGEESYGGSGEDQFRGFLTNSLGKLMLHGISDSGSGGGKTTVRASSGSGDWVVGVDDNLRAIWDVTFPIVGAVTVAADNSVQHVSGILGSLPELRRAFQWLEVSRVSPFGVPISKTRTEPEALIQAVGKQAIALQPRPGGGLLALLSRPHSGGYFSYTPVILTRYQETETAGAPRIRTTPITWPSGPLTQVELDTGFFNGALYYTLDGTVPTQQSTRYTNIFTVGSNALLRVKAVSGEGSQSVERTEFLTLPPYYTLHPLPPQVGGGAQFSVPFQNISAPLPGGTEILAQAGPTEGNVFLQWTGDFLSTNNNTSFALTRDMRVSALFGTTVTTQTVGSGSLIFEYPGQVQPYGTVRVNAVAATNNYLTQWEHTAEAANPTLFNVTAPGASVSATFAPLPSGKVSLSVPVFGPGTIEVSPRKLIYDQGEEVRLLAKPNSGAVFTGFSGYSGKINELVVRLDGSKVVPATFSGQTDRGFFLNVPADRASIASSTNLLAWESIAGLTNALGIFQILDLRSASEKMRFYRW